MNLIKSLEEKLYLYQVTNRDELIRLTSNNSKICAYIGFDCTASSLHIGSLMQIMVLRLLQQHGHKPIILLGGATTKIGDPTGKDSMRKILSNDEIDYNKAGIRKTLEKFLSFGSGKSDAIIVDNSDWLEKINYIEFLRNFGKYISVNKMLTMESAKQRLERESHLSFLEFNYMLFQAIDFHHLYKEYNCLLQIGGSDQWGNIIMGVELVRKLVGKEVFGLTTPLMVSATGAKMGKTEKGAVWLDESMLSSYDFFQFWRNIDDRDILKFAKYFGEFSNDEYNEFEKLHNDNINQAKKKLAYNITKLVHGVDHADNAVSKAENIFENNMNQDDMPQLDLRGDFLENNYKIYELLKELQLVKSNSEAKNLIRGRGVRINNIVIDDEHMVITKDIVTDNKFTISLGKKRHYSVIISSFT